MMLGIIGIPSPGPHFKALTVEIEDKRIKGTCLSIHKCPQSIRNKTPRSYENGTHVHSPFLCCALHLISRDAGVLSKKIREVESPAQGQIQQGQICISACPQGLFFWWATGNPWADTSAVTVCWVAKTPPRGVMPWCICASECLSGCSEAALWPASFDPSLLSAQCLRSSGMPGTLRWNKTHYQHCWCVYKGVFFHWKPLS